MKVYLFYLLGKQNIKKLANNGLLDWLGLNPEINSEALLYAYTNKKRHAEFFKVTRNPNLIKEKVVNMSKSEYNQLEGDLYKYCKIMINEVIFPIDEYDFYDPDGCIINFPFTTSEYWYAKECRAESINYFMQGLPKLPSINIFKEEYREILRDLGYCDMLVDVEGESINDMEHLTELAHYTKTRGWKNTIGVMLVLYGDLLNEEAIAEVITNGS